ncbi:MAG: response regulator, partial [Candidatus Thermoplasmatota archaeon]|nr:response regulator [Candidatus Thermoplasmatota archaeon]
TMRCLIVDPSSASRKKLVRHLERCRQRTEHVVEAEDVGAAVNAFDAEAADVVFVDLLAPGEFTALDAIEYFQDEHPDCEVVAMGSLSEDAVDVMAAKNVGVLAYLPKPVQPEAVQSVLDQIDQMSSGFGRIK